MLPYIIVKFKCTFSSLSQEDVCSSSGNDTKTTVYLNETAKVSNASKIEHQMDILKGLLCRKYFATRLIWEISIQ